MSNYKIVKGNVIDADGNVLGSVAKVERKVKGEVVTRWQATTPEGRKVLTTYTKRNEAADVLADLAGGNSESVLGIKLGKAPAAPKAKAAKAPKATARPRRDDDHYVRMAQRHVELKSYNKLCAEVGLPKDSSTIRAWVKKGHAILAAREAEAKKAQRAEKAAARKAKVNEDVVAIRAAVEEGQ